MQSNEPYASLTQERDMDYCPECLCCECRCGEFYSASAPLLHIATVTTPSGKYTYPIYAPYTGRAVEIFLKAYPWAEKPGNSWKMERA